ncbi:MAG TPA: 50S ribosomal protein L11 methyltransferase [Gaiellaceae bacterium]|nr:50S ribosomal protein L11 methyltransferase [Gaiellaceae bacterium]HLG07823.1 50S ribosomal protein L11 methyltransferase [Gaiellaceae bacterium]
MSLRAVVRRCAPPSLLAGRARRYRRRFRHALGVSDIGARFAQRHGATVLRGPFAGLRYPPDEVEAVDDLVAKLVGAYECELAEALHAAIARQPDTVVNVGCGDGFYAVGIARLLPDAVVHAFDIDRAARSLCRRVASLNGVAERVRVSGACTPARLAALELDGAFVLADCDGAEVELFAGEVLMGLRTASLVIELHPRPGMEVERLLVERFRSTHEVELVRARPRRTESYPELSSLEPSEGALALDELRGTPGSWVVLTPRGR